MEKEEVVERWAENVEELYKDENRGEDDSLDTSQMESEAYAISSEEIEAVIRDLPKGKACAIATTFVQNCCRVWGSKVYIQLMTSLINKIYKSGYIP